MTPSETVERTCWCPIREQIVADDGVTCWKCGGTISISLEELKVPYRDPSRAS